MALSIDKKFIEIEPNGPVTKVDRMNLIGRYVSIKTVELPQKTLRKVEAIARNLGITQIKLGGGGKSTWTDISSILEIEVVDIENYINPN